MRLSIEHRTRYRFTTPQARIVQLLRMTPENTYDQTVAAWHIEIDCDARMTNHRDGFGNHTTMLYCEGPLEDIELTVTGEVVTSSSAGVLHGSHETLPPAVFRRTTPTTSADAAVEAYARDLAGNADRAALTRLNAAIRDRFTLDTGRPTPGLTVTEAFARTALTARDMAQLFVAGVRCMGAPARYVSGYCDLAGDHRPTPHGWAEAWIAGEGWIGFDPMLGTLTDQHHVRVAVALDAVGAAPIAGSRLGEGVEALDVDVTVQAEG